MPVLGTPGALSSAVPPAWFNVKDFGALGNGTTDDTVAIQTAINTLKASIHPATGTSAGQTLYFPPGYYKISDTLNLSATPEIRVLGNGGKGGFGRAGINGGSTIALYHPNASTAPGVNMRESAACIWDGVSIVSRNTYNGTMLDLDTTGGSGGGDAYGHQVRNCALIAFAGANDLLSLAGAIMACCDNVTFVNGMVRMVHPTGPEARWSNANSFRSCAWFGDRDYSVLNPGSQTTFVDCTFEPSGGIGGPSSAPAPIAYMDLGNEPAECLTMIGCGFWDCTGSNGTGKSWIKAAVPTRAFNFSGMRFGMCPNGYAFDLANHDGLSVTGSRFSTEGTGTSTAFKPGQNITHGSVLGCVATDGATLNTGVLV